MPAATLSLVTDADLDAYESMGEQLAARLNESVRAAIEASRGIRAAWRSCCDAVGAGRTAEAHARRGEIEQSLRASLPVLRQISSQAERVAPRLPQEINGVDDLRALIGWLERFKDKVLAAWTGPDALEELAGEHYPLTSAELDVIAERYPAPAAWYEQEGKPF
jgi:hypothetical protein